MKIAAIWNNSIRVRFVFAVLTAFTPGTSPLHTAAAQTVSGVVLPRADFFQSAKPNDSTVKGGLNVQSAARRSGLNILRNLAKVSGSVERRLVRGATAGNGVTGNVLVNDPTLDTILSFPGFLPFEESSQNETSVAVFGTHVLVGYRSTAGAPIVNIGGNLFYEHIFISAYSISHDGGRTFTSGFVPPTPNILFTFGDPSVGVDRAGHFFYSSIGAAIGVDGVGHIAVQINRSDDYGNSFSTGVPVVLDDGATRTG